MDSKHFIKPKTIRKELLKSRVISCGSHVNVDENDTCALELVNLCLGNPKTDSPPSCFPELGILPAINDSYVWIQGTTLLEEADKKRTDFLLPFIKKFLDMESSEKLSNSRIEAIIKEVLIISKSKLTGDAYFAYGELVDNYLSNSSLVNFYCGGNNYLNQIVEILNKNKDVSHVSLLVSLFNENYKSSNRQKAEILGTVIRGFSSSEEELKSNCETIFNAILNTKEKV